MAWNVEALLARRLAWKQPGGKRPAAVTVAIAGVALSVMVMLLALAVVRGFKLEVRHTVLSLSDAITVTGYDAEGKAAPFRAQPLLQALAPALPPEARLEPRLSIAGILKTPDDFLGVNFRSSPDVDSVGSMILSRRQADALQLSLGDRVPVYFFAANRLQVKQLTLDSIYTTGVSSHDDALAYCSMALPAALLQLPPDYVEAVGIKNIDLDRVEPLTQQVSSRLLNAYYQGEIEGAYGITNVNQTDSQIFAWLNLIDTNVVVILVLMIAVAAFTLISSLFIIILERVGTIGLLKSLGATNRQIERTFMLMAMRLVFSGLAVGNGVALTLIFIQHRTHLLRLDPSAYYVDHVPASLSPMAWLLTNLAAVALSWCVLMLPALAIVRISPARTLRWD